MFLGHFGVALAAKKVDPRLSLPTCFAAAQLPDLIWPLLVLAGVERVTIAPGDTAITPLRFDSYPISHSLLMVTVLLLSATRARDAVGRWGLASLLGALAVIYSASVFGPPPPSVAAVAWTGVVGGIVLVAWAAWADRHREVS